MIKVNLIHYFKLFSIDILLTLKYYQNHFIKIISNKNIFKYFYQYIHFNKLI